MLCGQPFTLLGMWWVWMFTPSPSLCTPFRRPGGQPDEPTPANRFYREWSAPDILWHLWSCCPPAPVQDSYYPPWPEGNRPYCLIKCLLTEYFLLAPGIGKGCGDVREVWGMVSNSKLTFCLKGENTKGIKRDNSRVQVSISWRK